MTSKLRVSSVNTQESMEKNAYATLQVWTFGINSQKMAATNAIYAIYRITRKSPLKKAKDTLKTSMDFQ